MELRILRYFLAVAREENITKAAELLHITQPTLSRQLAQLEEDMGVTLFSRGARKVTLTDEGMLLRRRAEEIVDLADKTEKELTERDELINGVVSVGCGELASVQVIAEMFRAFKEKYPAVTYELYAGNADYTNDVSKKVCQILLCFWNPWILTGMILSVWGSKNAGPCCCLPKIRWCKRALLRRQIWWGRSCFFPHG